MLSGQAVCETVHMSAIRASSYLGELALPGKVNSLKRSTLWSGLGRARRRAIPAYI